MADTKITGLTENTTPVAADLLAIVDDVAGTPVTQKVTLGNVSTYLAAESKTLTNKTLTSPVISSIVNTGTITVPTQTGTILLNNATSGVGSCPTSSSTQTITHGLGRTPTIIRIYGVGRFTSNSSATPTPKSMGTWTSSGNRCVYMTTAGTTTQDGLSSATFSVFIATSSGNNMSGVIGNVTSTDFDIVWTETGTAAALPYMWEAQ